MSLTVWELTFMWQFTELLSITFPLDWIANSSSHGSSIFLTHWPDQIFFFAQAVRDVDILGDFANAWNNFIKTGQVWALIIGFVLGWAFRGFTGG